MKYSGCEKARKGVCEVTAGWKKCMWICDVDTL